MPAPRSPDAAGARRSAVHNQPSASRPLLEADEGGFRMSATASVALPGRSVSQPPQHIRALERANRVRLPRARKVLSAIPISENKELGSLTDRQRLALAHKLGRTVP